MAERAMVKNAGSEKQVRRAERKEKDYEARLLESIFRVMGTPAGRVFVWELLREARVYASVWDASGSKVYYNAGRQDFGHWLLAKVIEADENLYQTMEREARAWQRREDKDTDAAHNAGGDQGEQTDES